MKLTNEELIKLVEEYDSKAIEFEDKIRNNTTVKYSELEEYNARNAISLLSLIKMNQITIEEMLEQCVNQLYK